jgi:hypothetical protein
MVNEESMSFEPISDQRPIDGLDTTIGAQTFSEGQPDERLKYYGADDHRLLAESALSGVGTIYDAVSPERAKLIAEEGKRERVYRARRAAAHATAQRIVYHTPPRQ